MIAQNDSKEVLSENQVIEAVKNGNLTLLQKAILQGYDINQKYEYRNGYYYDEKTEESYEEDPYHYSLLSIACENEHKNIVEYLVKNGAKIYSETVLKTAVWGFEELKNPIVVSCEKNNLDILKFLVDNGGSLNVTQKSRGYLARARSLFDIAVFNNNMDIIKYLISKDKSLISLHAACQKENIEIVKYLISNGADVNQKRGETPLEAAGNNVEIIQLLLSKGARPSLFGIRYNPFYYNSASAALEIDTKDMEDMLSAIKLLIDSGADVNEERKNDKDNYSPLTLAIDENSYNAVKYLVEKGANYNIRLTRIGGTEDLITSSDYQSTLSLAKESLEEHKDYYEEDSPEMKQLKQIISYLKSLGVRDYKIDTWIYDNSAQHRRDDMFG